MVQLPLCLKRCTQTSGIHDLPVGNSLAADKKELTVQARRLNMHVLVDYRSCLIDFSSAHGAVVRFPSVSVGCSKVRA
jgi:hypothetical protein